jgi:hypothetical protein
MCGACRIIKRGKHNYVYVYFFSCSQGSIGRSQQNRKLNFLFFQLLRKAPAPQAASGFRHLHFAFYLVRLQQGRCCCMFLSGNFLESLNQISFKTRKLIVCFLPVQMRIPLLQAAPVWNPVESIEAMLRRTL